MVRGSMRYVLGLMFVLPVLQAQPLQTGLEGLYTNEQGTRGQSVYADHCASCHGAMLEGRIGPPLAGADFIANWNGRQLSELATKIRSTMPQDHPGQLSPEQTVDIIAFMLQESHLPPGSAELTPDGVVMQKTIRSPAQPASTEATPASIEKPSFPPAGNLAQVMRGILFPNSNIIFTVQTHDPGAPPKKSAATDADKDEGFNWVVWGGNLYSGWELVDYAAVALAESAPLMLTPGRRCENGKPVPVDQPDWIKFTQELAEAGRAAYRASQTRNQEAVSEISNQIADACLHCHQVYRDKPRRGSNFLDAANKANRCTK